MPDDYLCCRDSFSDPFASNASLVDRLIGNSYAVVKYVACNMAAILNVANYIKANANQSTTPAFQNVTATPAPVFDASKGSSFTMVLDQDVHLPSFINGLQGATVIVFRFLQDGSGGHDLTWPLNVHNGGVISKTPNSQSLQAFALNADGSLDAIGPILYS